MKTINTTHPTPAICLFAALALSACSGLPSQDEVTSSGFAAPTTSCNFNVGLTQTLSNGLILPNGEGFAFQTGARNDGGFISGMQNDESGNMVLDIDVASGAVDGLSGDGRLSIDGGRSGRDPSGSVTYRGVEGRLDGLADGDQAVGAFHCNNADLIYAGGFIANRAD